MTEPVRTSWDETSDGEAVEPNDLVRAAGGVVWRGGDGGIVVLVVHRPKYDDWSLPKGKLDPGESDEECAVREVEEETGLTCSLGQELTAVRYTDHNGRPKQVRYWTMTETRGRGGDDGFEPNDEVDELRWLPVGDARDLLSYEHDAEVLDGLPENLGT